MEDPSVRVAKRPLHFIWVVDCSNSITGSGRMADVDRVVVDSLPVLRDSVEEVRGISMLMRVLCFSNGARWHVKQPVDVREFRWDCPPLEGDGSADLGAAFDQLAAALQETMGRRGFRPLLVLLTDGRPTDEWRRALEAANCLPWFKFASKVAVALHADADMDVLREFIGNQEWQPLRISPVIVEEIFRRIVYATIPFVPDGLPDGRHGCDRSDSRGSLSDPSDTVSEASDWLDI